jgi:hypothetical protein
MNTQVVARQISSYRRQVWLAFAGSMLHQATAKLGAIANVMLAAMENSRSAQAARFIDAHSHLFID